MSCVSDGKVSGVQKIQTKWQTKWNKPLKRTPENIILQVNTSPQNIWHRIQSVHIEMNEDRRMQLLFSSRRTLKTYIEYNNVAVTHSTVIFIEI